jgi:Secretion system C-terminal sorting domain
MTWNTASERDNQGFTIERSTDATNYTSIGNVKGHGTTSTPQNYTFTDNTPATGSNYYRLRQTDVNGKETVSSVVSVLFGKGGLIIKSNLVHNTLDVSVGGEEKGLLSIFNISGQLIYSTKVQGSQSIDVSAFVAGVYIIRTASGEAVRFVKE